jgi:flavin reductase (DIM6/NTAB) family NADH-FMN oxidoreductase RutF
MTIDQAEFRTAMGHFASGVTVVTTRSGGEPVGLTVSAFCSLSLDPPLVLVCIEKSVRSHDAIRAAGLFAVNILARDQEHLSRRFASSADEKFEGVGLREGFDEVPLLEGALTVVQCRVRKELEGGDHTIFVGEVVEVEVGTGEPLLYYRGGYRELG